MKSLIGFIATLFVCFSSVASELSPIEKKQRNLVSRFYEILEMFPERCPQSARKEYIESVEKFEKTFPKFNYLIKKSEFRSYAINKFSNVSSVPKQTCLYYKEALDMQVDTEKGQQSMNKNIEVMRYTVSETKNEKQAKQVAIQKELTPHVWSDHKVLGVSVESCANKGKEILEILGFNEILKKENFIYGNYSNNRGVIKCVSVSGSTFVYTVVSGSEVKAVERLRNEIMWKL
jgi:hypothetical protein